MKIAVGVAVVTLVYCLIRMNTCKCARAGLTKVPVVTTMPIARPEKFAPYEADEEEEEEEQEYYSDYIPAQQEREDYVDPADVYSAPEFRSELLE
jgi:hypothetical protein